MTIRESGGRYAIEFQTCGKRIFRRIPKGIPLEDAEALEDKLRRDIFKEAKLEDEVDIAADMADQDRWQRLVNMLLHASGVQPVPGIYFLCKEGKLVYVGRSANVAHRLSGHRGKDYDHVMMVPADPANLARLEGFLIAMLRPPMNVNGST